MNFWKNHTSLRFILIALFFVVGLTLTLVGWKMTGELAGLGLMLVGIVLLLTALFVYNAAYNN
ncbi:MAG: hypothetical protein IJE58_03900 [Oscillospiraceae bacterium]|nr:hypothetical protein [Oscillospiraceae bacterium]